MKTADIQELSDFLLDYAVMLMRSGASTERTIRNVTRISKSFGYDIAIAVFLKNTTMTIINQSDTSKRRTAVKQQLPPHLSFSIVNDLSALSWQSVDTDVSLEGLKEKYSEIVSNAHSSKCAVLIFASLAIAAFCELFGGDYYAMLIVFFSTLVSFSLRYFLISIKFDLRAMIIAVSFTASILAYLIGSFIIPTNTLNVAISTSVLFLIPGVHIINSVVDILDGHILTGISRTVSAMILVICIAVGLYATLLLTGWMFL